MDMNKRALYNSLRMNWILDPTLNVEIWQIEDYRAMPLDEIFERLEDKNIHLDKTSFSAFAEAIDHPEDLTEDLLSDSKYDTKWHDQVYLLIFELWRRLLPEKQCVSILCDEIDHQIHLYDQDELTTSEAMADTLANLQLILDENTDEGAEPNEAFECINAGCANDLESFLHDFISNKIDEQSYTYATELLEGFSPYLNDDKWFDFLRARLTAITEPEEANQMIKDLIRHKSDHPDLEFNLEMLSFLIAIGDRETFEKIAKQTGELLHVEEDFQALISISADFYHRLDEENVENALLLFLKKRESYHPKKRFQINDPDLASFFHILSTH